MIKDNLRKFKVEKSKKLRVTSKAGLAVIGSFAREIGLFEELEGRLKGLRERERGYKIYEKIFYIMGLVISGGSRLRHIGVLNSDEGLLELFGRDRIPRDNTLGYFLKKFKRRDIWVLSEINTDLVRKGIKALGLRHITIDQDSSLVESEKEEAKKTYKGFYGYNPIFGMIKELGMVIRGVFRDGNSSPMANNESLLRKIHKEVKGLGIKRIYFRADSAGFNHKTMRYCEENGLYFGIGIRGTELMRKVIRAIPEVEWEEYKDGMEIAETVYFIGPEKGGGAYRVVVTRKRPRDIGLFIGFGYEYHGVITNIYHWDKKAVMRWYSKRGDAENIIKELKNDYSIDKIPTGELLANSAYFQIILLAYNLMKLFTLTILPQAWRRYRLKTLRFIFINIAGVVRRHARQIKLIISEYYIYYDIFYYSRYKALNPSLYL